MKDDLQTLLDIQSSNSFSELKSMTAQRLTGMQMSFAAEDERRKTGCSGLGCTNYAQPYGTHMCHK